MKSTLFRFAGLCTLAMAALWAVPAGAQMAEVKEKPRMYSYVSFWNIPRAQWGAMEKADADDKPLLDKAVAGGTLVGYGNDVNLVHQVDGSTHDEWWSSMSMAGLMNVLNQFYANGSATSSVAGKCHQTLGWHFRQPLLQLASRIVAGSVRRRGSVQTERQRAG